MSLLDSVLVNIQGSKTSLVQDQRIPFQNTGRLSQGFDTQDWSLWGVLAKLVQDLILKGPKFVSAVLLLFQVTVDRDVDDGSCRDTLGEEQGWKLDEVMVLGQEDGHTSIDLADSETNRGVLFCAIGVVAGGVVCVSGSCSHHGKGDERFGWVQKNVKSNTCRDVKEKRARRRRK